MPHDHSDWDTGEAIRDHYLSTTIINEHTAEEGNFVFDPSELLILERFCDDPTPSNRDAIMAEYGYGDAEAAAEGGRLTCFLIGRHDTNDPAFDDRDIELLQDWFRQGMPTGQNVVR